MPKKMRKKNIFFGLKLTKLHRTPGVEALIVAARGILYMRASSPKKPLPSYEPTLLGPVSPSR